VPEKLQAGAAVMCNLLQSADEKTASDAVTFLGTLLVHRFPRVRQSTAHKLYEALATFDIDDLGIPCKDQDKLDSVSTLLAETSWDESLEQLIPIKNDICDMLSDKK